MENLKKQIAKEFENIDRDQLIEKINDLREFIHEFSPFKKEPVDFVKWVKNENVVSNDYNPNKVAPPEMELLEISILNDGYTQPIVTWPHDGKIEVIDGFHRNRVGKESKLVSQRIQGYLPTVIIRHEQSSKNDRIASTIRHNRARGKHQVDAMSEIVIELKNRNWSNSRIAKQLGMDEEEVLRLCQISGLENIFKDSDFSKAWESKDYAEGFEPITDDLSEEDVFNFRTANTNDSERIFHTYDKWECHKAGFYKSNKEGWSHQKCEIEFMRILCDLDLFSNILEKLIVEWKYSCEHYLTNKAMNRIAWLGQAAVCFNSGIPSRYSSAWSTLTESQQQKANEVALKYLNIWREKNGLNSLTMDEAISSGRQIEIY